MFCFNKIKIANLFIIFLISAVLLSSNFFFKPLSAQITLEDKNIESSFSVPIKITINARANLAFILNRGASEITVFDGKTKEALFNLPTGGKGSISMTRSVSGNLYVLNRGSNNVTVFPFSIIREGITQDSINQVIMERKFIPVGKSPIDLAYNRNLQNIYVLNGDSTLSVIDEQTNQVITTLKLKEGTSQIKINQETDKIYAINRDESSLFLIDGKTNELIKIISIDSRPSDLAIGADKIFVSSYENDNIYIIDSITDELITAVKSGGRGPREIGLNETSKKLYVSHWLDNSLTVIDALSLKLLKKIPLAAGAYPSKPSINERSNYIFVSNVGIRSVSIIDGDRDEIINTLETGVNPKAPVINLETEEVYILNPESNSVTIIFKNDEGQFTSLTIPDQKGIVGTGENLSFPLRLAINETADEIYVLNNLAGNFVILDGKTYEVKGKIPVGENPREILFLSSLNKVFISNGDDNSITVYDIQNKSWRTILAGNKPVNLLFNPQTQKLYVINYDSYDVSVINAENETHLVNIFLGGRPEAIALNQKENKIYIAMVGNNEIIIINGENDQILKRIETEPKPVNLLFDGIFNRLYVGYSVGENLTIIDGTTDQIIKTLAVGDGNSCGFLTFNETAKRIYINIVGQNLVKVLDPDSLEIIPPDILIIGAGNSRKTIIDQKNQKLFILTPKALNIIDLEKNKILHSLNISGRAASLAGLAKIGLTDMVFNPNSDKLFIALGGANALAVVDVEKNLLEALITDKEIIMVPLEDTAPFLYLRVLLVVLAILFIFSGIAIWKKWSKKKKELPVSQ